MPEPHSGAADLRQSQMVADYESGAEPLTRQCIGTAVVMVGGIHPGMAVLDVAAGTGALSVAAAEAGARVLATDISSAMLARLSERLKPHPECAVRVMDVRAIDLEEGAFDVTFSLFGALNLPDWHQGLRDLARVTRLGGHCCVSTWRDPRAVGAVPFLLDAWSATFPDVHVFPPEGLDVPRSPEVLRSGMTAAGFGNVDVREVEVTWTSPSVETFLAERNQLYGFLPAYAALDPHDRDRLVPALRDAALAASRDRPLATAATALVAAGQRPAGDAA
jgi:SAM-dependent methyltransferase